MLQSFAYGALLLCWLRILTFVENKVKNRTTDVKEIFSQSDNPMALRAKKIRLLKNYFFPELTIQLNKLHVARF